MTYYEFTKDGKTYRPAAGMKNRLEAQWSIELQFQTSLKGAAFEELDKHNKVIRTGICR